MTLTEALEKQGWTQRDLAKKSDVSEQEISRMVRGSWTSLPVAERVARALNHTIDIPDMISPAEAMVMQRWHNRRVAAVTKKEGGK